MVISLSAFVLVSAPAFAASSVSVDFESPYTNGSINGQFGWVSLGSIGSGCATYDHAVSNSFGTTGFGSQSLRISDAYTSGCFGDNTFAPALADSVGESGATAGAFSPGVKQQHFELRFDFASAVPTAEQLGMHVSVSPDRGDGSRMSYLRFEDVESGVDVYFDDVTGITNPANFNDTKIATLDRALTHNIKLTLDTLDGPSNDVVKVWIDGVQKATGTSWENYYRYDSEASPENSPRIVKTVIFRTSGDANINNATKGFLFDNLTLSSGPIVVASTKDQCKNNGWKTMKDTSNKSFKNQGDCVSFFSTNGRNLASY